MIVVTGATGKLGHHVIEGLLKTVPAQEIVAAVRNPGKAEAFTAQGIQARAADYGKPETLAAAFAGAEKVLLISSSDLNDRVGQHKAAIDAARAAGVKLLVYTSLLRAADATTLLAADHKATEAYLQASGVPFVVLRNGWYLENHTEAIAPALQHGAVIGASGEGRFAAASRADFAAAAVAVLTTNGHEGKRYELAGDNSYSLTEYAAEVSKQAGKPVVFANLPEEKYAEALAGFGLPAPLPQILANADSGASRGELDETSHTLRKLIGRATTPLAEAVKAALAAL
jgi:NAD(P)H dehydrogenase (quinone)